MFGQDCGKKSVWDIWKADLHLVAVIWLDLGSVVPVMQVAQSAVGRTLCPANLYRQPSPLFTQTHSSSFSEAIAPYPHRLTHKYTHTDTHLLVSQG